jgi:hypothetical protein
VSALRRDAAAAVTLGNSFPMSNSACDALEVIWPLHRRH